MKPESAKYRNYKYRPPVQRNFAVHTTKIFSTRASVPFHHRHTCTTVETAMVDAGVGHNITYLSHKAWCTHAVMLGYTTAIVDNVARSTVLTGLDEAGILELAIFPYVTLTTHTRVRFPCKVGHTSAVSVAKFLIVVVQCAVLGFDGDIKSKAERTSVEGVDVCKEVLGSNF